MSRYFAPTALLPDGWAHDVELRTDAAGDLVSVTEGASSEGTEPLRGIAVPGMINLHSHGFQRAMAGLTERGGSSADSFWSWRSLMYRFLDRLTPEDYLAIATQLYVEMLRSGYTSVVEFHYVHNDLDGQPYPARDTLSRSLLSAASVSGIGLTHLPVLYTSGGFGAAPPTKGQRRFTLPLDELLALVRSLGGESDGQLRIGLGLHSLRAVTPDELHRAVESARKLDPSMPIHIHVAEQEREVQDCLAWSGSRPVEWLLREAHVDERWCLVHATHMTTEETAAVAASGAVVGLCPTTEANLGDGIFPLPDFLAAGGTFGVGSDSNVTVSPSSELRLLEYGQRLHHRRRNVVSRAEDASTGTTLYREALRGGSQAAGRPVGGLVAGNRADIVVLDGEHATLTGRVGDSILDSWVFAEAGCPVLDVMVGGRWVVRSGLHPLQDSAVEGYRKTLARLTAALVHGS